MIAEEFTLKLALCVALAYVLGCFNAAYYLHRALRGTDIRAAGSGNPGARNAGRVLGWPAFGAVFVVDAAKGALAVYAALAIAGSLQNAALASVAVVIGHIWPIQLGFRGGRGIATAFGAALALAPVVALVSLGVAAALVIILRRPALAGLLGMVAAPIVAAALGCERDVVFACMGIAVVAIVAHRSDFGTLWRDRVELPPKRPVS